MDGIGNKHYMAKILWTLEYNVHMMFFHKLLAQN